MSPSWEAGDTIDSYLAKVEAAKEEELQAARDKELQEAYAVVSKAIATHRWWGWTSLVNHARMTVTRIKLWLGMRLWP